MNILHKSLRITAYIAAGVLQLLVIILFLLSTQLGNDLLLKPLLGFVNGEIGDEIKIDAESLSGNIYCKWKFHNLVLYSKQDKVLRTETLEIGNNILFSAIRACLWKEVSINSISFINPKFSFQEDTLTQEEDTESNVIADLINKLDSSGLSFKLDKLIIQDGSGKIQYLSLEKINSELNFEYSDESKSINLNRLSADIDTSFNLKNLSFNISVCEKSESICLRSFNMRSENSYIDLSEVTLYDLRPEEISLGNVKKTNFKIVLDSVGATLRDAKYFLGSDTAFLKYIISPGGRSLSLKTEIERKNDSVNIKFLNIKVPGAEIKFNGMFSGIDNFNIDTDSLKTKFLLETSTIRYIDVAGILKNADSLIGKFSYIDTAYFKAELEGNMKNILFNAEIMTGTGALNIKGKYDNYAGMEKFRGEFFGENLRVKRGTVNGLKDLTFNGYCDLTAELNKSRLERLKTKFSLSHSKYDKYIATTASGQIDYLINKRFDADNIFAVTNFGTAAVTGNMIFNKPGDFLSGSYEAKGFLKNANMQAIDPNTGSDLNFRFDVKGKGIGYSPTEKGFTIDDIKGVYNLNFDNSRYKNTFIPADNYKAEINIENSEGMADIFCSMAKIQTRGTYNVTGIVDGLVSAKDALLKRINNKIYGPDSIVNEDITLENEKFAVGFKIYDIDKESLNRLVNPLGFAIDGNISGNFLNDSIETSLDLFLNPGFFHLYNKDESKFLFDADSLAIALESSHKDISVSSMGAYKIDAAVRSNNITIDSFSLKEIKLDLLLDTQVVNFNLDGGFKGVNSVYIKGAADLKDTVRAELEHTRFSLDKYQDITNHKPVVIHYHPLETLQVKLDTARFYMNEMNASLEGSLGLNGVLTVIARIPPNLLSGHIKNFLNGNKPSKEYKHDLFIDLDLRETQITFDGDVAFSKPHIGIKLDTTKILFLQGMNGGSNTVERIPVGNVFGNIGFADTSITPDLTISESNKGKIIIGGKYHIGHLSDINSNALPNAAAELNLSADNFDFEKILGLFTDKFLLGGKLNGKVNTAGNLSGLSLTGAVNIQDGKIELPLTGMKYQYDFKIKEGTTSDTLTVAIGIGDKIIPGTLMVDGRMILRDLSFYDSIKPSSTATVKLNINGALPLLAKDVENEIGIKGDLKMRFNNYVQWDKGDLLVEDSLIIMKADIYSVRQKKSSYNLNDDFVYVYESDSVKEISTPKVVKSVTAKLTVRAEDKVRINVDLGNGNFPIGRLFGNINANDLIKIDYDNKELNIVGEIDFKDESYLRLYRFFKFDKGTITLSGDLKKPSSDIDAFYTKSNAPGLFDDLLTQVRIDLTARGNLNFSPGELELPPLDVLLRENGNLVTRIKTQNDALSFLLFGKYSRNLDNISTTILAPVATISSAVASQFLGKSIPEIQYIGIDFAGMNDQENSILYSEPQLHSNFSDFHLYIGGAMFAGLRNSIFSLQFPQIDEEDSDLINRIKLEILREQLDIPVSNRELIPYGTGFKATLKF